uniref:Leprecan-like alpha-helical domain-containing protein n=1 Tax=Lepeophtheirus salmonis TaxID=72036 RepID=A0A0K2T554_LEPSM
MKNQYIYSKGSIISSTMKSICTLLLCLIVSTNSVSSSNDIEQKSYEELFAISKNSYLANDWRNCIKFMKAALSSYDHYEDIVKECRNKCDHLTESTAVSTGFSSLLTYENSMNFYETLINGTYCMMKCKRQKLGSYQNSHPDPEIVKNFETRLTYDYLQSCYYKVNETKNAADAAFTNLEMNPESEVMRDNLNFYFEKNPKLKYDELVNLETKNFVKSFRDGVDAYEKEDFDSVIRYFELGILEYIDAWKTCRLSCEKPFDMGWFPDFMTSVANHFTYCVRCKRQCLIKLANLDGEFHHDIFPLMFHYLQFAYYKNNDIRKSAECIESYMTLYDSKQMISNKEYYQELDEFKKSGNEAWFTPRDNVREYFEIIKRENDLINSIEDRFKFEEDSKESKVPEPPISNKMEL